MSSRGYGTVFTIGHSNHRLEGFVGLLVRHAVTALADVRSVPFSRFNPHFRRESLSTALRARGMRYVFLGRELGGRPNDVDGYEDGRVSYERVARTERFREGIDRVVHGAAAHRVALMCAEKEPLDCHRTLLVGRALDERGIAVVHIHADGGLEPHGEAMDRLLAGSGLEPEDDLFRRRRSREELIAEAIERKTGRAGRIVPRPAVAGGRTG